MSDAGATRVRYPRKCIYCHASSASFSTKEHIFPESLGGGDWAILPDGLMCDACQNYFGTKVEGPVLSDWPFQYLRFSMAIRTKKKRHTKVGSDLGFLTACDKPGCAILHSSSDLALAPGDTVQEEIPAYAKNPRLVCRALVKMALGFLAAKHTADVFAAPLDAARRFARYDDQRTSWWYSERVDLKEKRRILEGNANKRRELIVARIVYLGRTPALFHLKYFFLETITPYDPRFIIESPQASPESAHIYNV